MTQGIVVTPGKADSMRVAEFGETEPAAGEALIETIEVGVCGTDRTINAGEYGAAPAGVERLVIGHEAVGRVRQPAGGVERGAIVAATVRRPCGGCSNCAEGEVDACTTGRFLERGILGLDGFASETFAEHPRNLVAIPAELGRLGVLAEPMSVCERGFRHAEVVGHRQGWEPRRAIVLGVGAIGMLTTYLLSLHGIETWALARRPAEDPRVALVRESGAEYVSLADTSISDLGSEIGGADLILEAAGSPTLAAEAIGALGKNGVLCLRGINPSAEAVELPASVLMGEMVLGNKSVIGSTNAAPVDWSHAVEDLTAIESRWPGALDQMLGRTVAPDDFAEALSYDGVKATISFS